MEYLWSMYGVSTLLLPANLQINLEEKENKSTKFAKELEKYYRKMLPVVLLMTKTKKNILEMKVCWWLLLAFQKKMFIFATS